MFGDFPNVNEVKLVTESIKKLESIHANTIMYSAMLCMIDAWKYGKNDLPQDSIDLFDEFKERISALEAELAKAREEIKTLKDAPPNVHKEIEKTVKFLDGNDWQNCKNEFFSKFGQTMGIAAGTTVIGSIAAGSSYLSNIDLFENAMLIIRENLLNNLKS